jgi:predicted RNA-binding protein with PUA-like domain
MRIGDQALFYHSNSDPSGIVGVMQIISGAYPDPTQFDPSSRYYDPRSTSEKPIWFVRDVQFVSKFPQVISLAQLRSTPGLEKMAVNQKGQRLSITPVSPEEWEIIMKTATQVGVTL